MIETLLNEDTYEIFLKRNVGKFYELEISNINYNYCQVHEDFSLHLFLMDLVGVNNITDFYMSCWKLFLEKFNMPPGSTQQEIEEVFRDGMEEEEKIVFKRLGLDEFKRVVNHDLNIELLTIFNAKINTDRNFRCFKELTDTDNHFVEYLFWDESNIGLLYFM